MTGNEWDARYAGEAFAFGTEPNDFLVEVAPRLPAGGRVLSLAEGEGRNAVWLAAHGFEVHSVDGSEVGVAKTLRLAAERGVTVHAATGRLEDLDITPGAWDVIVSVFVHQPPPLRAEVHRKVAAGLAPGGMYVMEAYSPDHWGRGTGGPPHPERLVPLQAAMAELAGLEFLHAAELERDVVEGHLHTGDAAVTQILARKAG
ncbi:MAG: class I SAM-dependent methyltransferase [Thermoleophilia bacterium]